MRTSKFVMVLVAMVFGVLFSAAAEAGPFGYFGRSRTCSTPAVAPCSSCVQPEQVVSSDGCGSCHGSRQGMSTGSINGTAQDVADTMARSGRRAHRGNPAGGYEGIGEGSSPESALANCCQPDGQWRGMRVVDIGTAYGHGRWWACKRYNWR